MPSSVRVVRFINVAHALDHLVMLIFPTALLGMGDYFGLSYGELIALSLGGFIAFGAGSLPAGWLGDKWSRRNMMAVFFFGVGAASILTAFATTPFMLAACLTLTGVFAAIYHPVGTAMLIGHAQNRLGRTIGVNGVWGNVGVAVAALFTGALTQYVDWRAAFVVPGIVAIGLGAAFMALVPDEPRSARQSVKRVSAVLPRGVVIHAFSVLVLVTIAGSVVFNATTVALPKVFDERLPMLASTPFRVGFLAFTVYMIGAVAQLIVGHFIDRYPLRTVFLPLSLLQAPCLLLAAWASEWNMLVVAVGMMFGNFGQVTINDAMVARYTNEEWRGRAYAFRYVMSFVASALGVPLVAYFHDHSGGFTATFIVLACFGLLVFIGALMFPHRPEELEVIPVRAQAAE